MKLIIFESYYEAMKMLSEEACGRFIMSVMAYAFEGVEPTFDAPVEKVAWQLMKPNIDASMNRQDAGSKGGRPSKSKLSETDKASLKPSLKPSLKASLKASFREDEKPALKPPYPKDKDKDKDKEREEENARGSAAFPSFLKQCVEVFNAETGKTIIDTEIAGTTLMRVRNAYDNGRTVDEVRRAVKSAMEQWKPEMVTFNAIFKGSRIAELSAGKKDPPKPKEWPKTMPCPKCGADSYHVGGGVYSCPDGHEAWKETA